MVQGVRERCDGGMVQGVRERCELTVVCVRA